MKSYVLVLLLFLLLPGCPQQGEVAVMPDGTVVEIEIALTPQEHTQGLSDREALCENCGMLFVFNDSSQRGFWMHRMNFPLDMIFLDKEYEVIDVAYNMEPCKSECMVYRSREGAKYVLEVNTGFASEHGVEKGERLEIRYDEEA